MSIKFQVNPKFLLTRGKPSLVNITLTSTKSAVSKVPEYPYFTNGLTIKRIFKTLEEAHDYISYLNRVYKISPVVFPELDCEQLKLF